MTATVTDQQERDRYEIHVDGELAGFADYRRRGSTIVFTHAEVADEFEGQGLASQLARESLDEARAAEVSVIPACPFYADFLQRHPEYVDLVPEPRRAEFDLV